MEIIQIVSVSAVSILVFMTLAWFAALIVGKLSTVDIAWGLGFIVVSVSTLLFNATYSPRQILVTILVCLWGARLAFYIYIRNKGRGEDFRYEQMKEKWQHDIAIQSYLRVFLLQGLFMLFVSFAVQIVNSDMYSTPLNFLDVIGALLWLFGFLFETIGDLQMYLFKKDPKNKGEIMMSGLWKYTRHPNYFGESVQWWAIFIIGLSATNGILGLISPVLITFMLLRVSGVPMLEAKYAKNKKYQKYIKMTSSFIPFLKPR